MVHGNQIDMAFQILYQFAQFPCMMRLVIHSAEQPVLECNPAVCNLLIVLQGIHQLVDIVRSVDRHQSAAYFIICSMQAHCEIDLDILICKIIDPGYDAAGRYGNMARTDIQTVIMIDDPEELHHLVVVLKRLPDAHDDDAAHALIRFIQGFLDLKHLGNDFSRFKVAFQSAQRRSTEDAADAAADLRCDTDRIAVVMTHQDGLDRIAVPYTDYKFHRAVFALLPHRGCQTVHVLVPGKLFAESFRQVQHFMEMVHTVDVEPFEYLLSPVVRFSPFHRLLFQFIL